MRLTLRDSKGERPADWTGPTTALILCDVWDRHWCRGASGRVDELAPAINRTAAAARRDGALIIHAPSGTMPFYEGTPQRERAATAPMAAAPVPLDHWFHPEPAREGSQPIDDSDGGCNDQPPCPTGSPWTRQHEAVTIDPQDAITESGQEVWNLVRANGIQHILIAGVHLNMCVIGRPFGIRALSAMGMETALLRDLTDTMYCQRSAPYVSHSEGTRLMVEHVERYWCPSVRSSCVTGEPAFAFSLERGE